MQTAKTRRRDRLWSALLAAWLMATLAGAAGLWRYKLTPAEPVATPAVWPAASAVVRAGDVATLVMLAHPRCPCTRASVAELGRLVQDVRGRVDAHLLVVRPPGVAPGWEHTDLWERAAAIPGLTVHADLEGHEARRFGATVSGHVVVYGPAGELRFHGGITGARGHEGDNTGRARATAAILGGRDDADGPTFGCALLGAEEIDERSRRVDPAARR